MDLSNIDGGGVLSQGVCVHTRRRRIKKRDGEETRVCGRSRREKCVLCCCCICVSLRMRLRQSCVKGADGCTLSAEKHRITGTGADEEEHTHTLCTLKAELRKS